jgi:hypothetical protein
MLEAHKTTLDKAIKALGALEKGTDVRWSINVDGETYGNAELAVFKLSSRTYKYKRGETRSYYQPFLDKLEVGDITEIPFNGFVPAILTSNIGGTCWKMWGTGSYTVIRLDTKGVVQVMRLA